MIISQYIMLGCALGGWFVCEKFVIEFKSLQTQRLLKDVCNYANCVPPFATSFFRQSASARDFANEGEEEEDEEEVYEKELWIMQVKSPQNIMSNKCGKFALDGRRLCWTTTAQDTNHSWIHPSKQGRRRWRIKMICIRGCQSGKLLVALSFCFLAAAPSARDYLILCPLARASSPIEEVSNWRDRLNCVFKWHLSISQALSFSPSLSLSPESTRYHPISSPLQVRRETLLFAKDGLYNLYMGLQLDRDFVWLLKMSINDDDDLSEWSSHTLNIRSFTFVINFHNFTVKQARTGVRQAGR